MHGRHDYFLHHHKSASRDTVSGYELRPSAGHNAPVPAQWQSPSPARTGPGEPEQDFDLVESAFAESFPTASDPTSFLRLAGIPFRARDVGGAILFLLRVELDQVTDLGSVTPQLGGGPMRYDPLPAQMVSRRRHLRFAYQRESETVLLSFGEARSLQAVSTHEQAALV